jgi:hypothetical protein
MSNNTKQNNTAEILCPNSKTERNRESKIWADGSKYGLTFNIEGVTELGQPYAADVSVLIQVWTDINDRGGFALTCDARIEKFTEAGAYLPTPEGRGAGWNYSMLTEEQFEAEEAAQEKANDIVQSYLDRVCYEPQFEALRNSLKQEAIKYHLNLR